MRRTKFAVGNIYHVFNRGVEKRDIFLSDSDRWRFLQGMYLFNNEGSSAGLLWHLENRKGALNFNTLKGIIEEQKIEKKPIVRIMADCLMPNHYHLLLQELSEGGISSFMHKLGVGYTKYFNKKYKRVGSLFQGTFKAVLVEKDLYAQYLLAYINVLNPGQLIEPELKEKGVRDINAVMRFAEDYQWSTHQEYLGKRNSVLIEKGVLGELFSSPERYLEFARDVLISKKYDSISDLLLE